MAKEQLTKEQLTKVFVEKLKECEELGTEEGHGHADWLLCELLELLGFEEVVVEFENLKKWYA